MSESTGGSPTDGMAALRERAAEVLYRLLYAGNADGAVLVPYYYVGQVSPREVAGHQRLTVEEYLRSVAGVLVERESVPGSPSDGCWESACGKKPEEQAVAPAPSTGLPTEEEMDGLRDLLREARAARDRYEQLRLDAHGTRSPVIFGQLTNAEMSLVLNGSAQHAAHLFAEFRSRAAKVLK